MALVEPVQNRAGFLRRQSFVFHRMVGARHEIPDHLLPAAFEIFAQAASADVSWVLVADQEVGRKRTLDARALQRRHATTVNDDRGEGVGPLLHVHADVGRSA